MRFSTLIRGIGTIPQSCVSARDCDLYSSKVFFSPSLRQFPHMCVLISAVCWSVCSSKGTLKISGFLYVWSSLFYNALLWLSQLLWSHQNLYSWSQGGSAWVVISWTSDWDYILQTGAIIGLNAFVLSVSGISVLCCFMFSALRTIFFPYILSFRFFESEW